MQATYIALYGTLQNSSEDDASDIMRRIRSGEPASTVAAEVHAGKVLYETSRGEQQPSPSGSECRKFDASISASQLEANMNSFSKAPFITARSEQSRAV